jgi:hypothetical protein
VGVCAWVGVRVVSEWVSRRRRRGWGVMVKKSE